MKRTDIFFFSIQNSSTCSCLPASGLAYVEFHHIPPEGNEGAGTIAGTSAAHGS
jgi:hypothetical protein